MKLPRIAPRGDEVKAVEEILESGEYENATKMARAIVAETYARLLDRDWYIIAERNDGGNLLYGMFATQNAAIKTIPDLALSGQVGIFKVRSLSARRVRVEELDEYHDESKCASCGHEQAAHEFPQLGGRCAGTSCGCVEFRKGRKERP